jgi:hypothetical protein
MREAVERAMRVRVSIMAGESELDDGDENDNGDDEVHHIRQAISPERFLQCATLIVDMHLIGLRL